MSQLAMPLESPLPPPPSQHSSPGFAQGASAGTRLPPPPPLPTAFRPQRAWPDTSASPAGDSDVSPRLARLGEEQVRQGLQEVSGGERVGGELPSAQQDVGPAHSGSCTSSGPPEGAVDLLLCPIILPCLVCLRVLYLQCQSLFILVFLDVYRGKTGRSIVSRFHVWLFFKSSALFEPRPDI